MVRNRASALQETASRKREVSVGVGALAGSTVMLLTLPWCEPRKSYRLKPKEEQHVTTMQKERCTFLDGMELFCLFCLLGSWLSSPEGPQLKVFLTKNPGSVSSL